jgi:hypothetical protein
MEVAFLFAAMSSAGTILACERNGMEGSKFAWSLPVCPVFPNEDTDIKLRSFTPCLKGLLSPV